MESLETFIQAMRWLRVAFLLLLMGCVGPDSFGGTHEAISTWGKKRGFIADEVVVESFRLLRLIRKIGNGESVTVYIEGDGAPWPSPWYPPIDPTPLKPISMALAAADPAPVVSYFGRPCQYLNETLLATCSPSYWKERRFAPEVVTAYHHALDELKKVTGTQRLRLVGYSGGGVIATLLAAERSDVELLVTVATPLIISEWVAWHGLSPLLGSLDPGEFSYNVRLPPNVHFSGDHDRIVPLTIIERFANRHGGKIVVVPGFGHECCWSHSWQKLINHLSNAIISPSF